MSARPPSKLVNAKTEISRHSVHVLNGCCSTNTAIEKICQTYDQKQEDCSSAFYVLDCDQVIELYGRWRKLLPRVTPFYAVKCNNQISLLRLLASLGCGFDCASAAECDVIIQQIGIHPKHIVLANPCKSKWLIKHARKHSVDKMTFDSPEELMKIHSLHPNAKLLLRIHAHDKSSLWPLAGKFGCQINDAQKVLELAASLNMNVIGISFVWSQQFTVNYNVLLNQPINPWPDLPHYYFESQKPESLYCRFHFWHKHQGQAAMTLLDIGGGFSGAAPSANTFTLETAAPVINQALQEHFPIGCGVTVIAEPGTYFAEEPIRLCCRVFACASVPAHQITQHLADANVTGYKYHVNASIFAYGAFTCTPQAQHNSMNGPALKERSVLHITVSRTQCSQSAPLVTNQLQPPCAPNELFWSTVWGVRTDPNDRIIRKLLLPKLKEGSWLQLGPIGAYDSVVGCSFEGFSQSATMNLIHEHNLAVLKGPFTELMHSEHTPIVANTTTQNTNA